MPAWPETNDQTRTESREVFLRRTTLCIAPFPNMGWGRSPDFLHSKFVHNIPAGAFLSRVQAIELTLPVLNLRRQYEDNIHVACNQCCILALARLISAAKCLKSLRISLNGCYSYQYRNVYISLAGLKTFWETTANLDRFEIFIEERFGYWEAAASFCQSLEHNFARLALDIPALKSNINYKVGLYWYEVECSLVYKR